MILPRTALILLIAGLTLANAVVAQAWSPKTGPLMTRWAAQVDPVHPLPEYPRPQMVRADWLSLNGVWEYQPGRDNDALPASRKLSSQILVPFPVESALSGVMEHHYRLWYRRTFTVPVAWNGRQVMLHFGAVDYESEVFINGKSVGIHRGGYDPFSFDITSFLSGSAEPQEIVVRVYDPTEEGGQPRGKQTTRPAGVIYSSNTGIWQTVWLEPVARGGVSDLKLVPDVDASQLRLTVNTTGEMPAENVSVIVRSGKTVVGMATGETGKEMSVQVPGAKLWSPDQPSLYDLQVSVLAAGKVIDEVGSYFGMRKIEIGEENGIKKMLLNGKFVFQCGLLDQGYWPDGIYTAPTEEALKYDIETMKQCGFNMVRKHLKVEPARWYYWCDKLGLLVWQDMPSANTYANIEWSGPPANTWKRIDRQVPPVDTEAFERELRLMVQTHWNTPSIIMWDIFNEHQGQHDTGKLVNMVKKLDPSRLVDEASGDQHFGFGDVRDTHHYPNPACQPPNKTEALACGEYGGIGMQMPGHLWVEGRASADTEAGSPTEFEDRYAEFAEQVRSLRDKQGMSAAAYTQLTDVETEINGLLTYDRVPKGDLGRIARANHFQLPPITYTNVVPTSETNAQNWKYAIEPPPEKWMQKDFDDSTWTMGQSGSASEGTMGVATSGIPWKTPHLWLRRTYNPGALTAEQITNLVLRDFHGGDMEVYLNGVLACRARGTTAHYENQIISLNARRAIVPNAENVLAVSCKQTTGGQCIDAGLSLRKRGEE